MDMGVPVKHAHAEHIVQTVSDAAGRIADLLR